MKNYYVFILTLTVSLNVNISLSNQTGKHEENSYKLSIPKILSESDKKIYLEINSLHLAGKWDEANEKKRNIKNKLLLGYLEYDKLMHPNRYRSSYQELYDWIKKYNDYPVVMQRRVYNLMVKRSLETKAPAVIKKPKYGKYLRGYGENKKKYETLIVREQRNKRIPISENLSTIITNQEYKKIFDYYQANQKLKLEIIYALYKEAEKNFYRGNLEKSFSTFDFLISKIKIKDPQTFFKAGLNAFRLKNYNKSSELFRSCNIAINNSEVRFSPRLKSACSYWEAKLTSNKQNRRKLLLLASKHDRTLYGQLAIEKLNYKENFKWTVKDYENLKNENENIYKLNAFKRLIALSELNAYDKADLEMRNLYSKLENNKSNNKFLFHLSEKLDLAAVQMRLGESFVNKDYILFMRGMYPTPAWILEDGFIFDKAFIYAIIRRESAFHFRAKSAKGARGLMQLMPRTASKIKKDYRLRYGHKHQLYTLELNLELGQKLLKELVKNPNINNSILNTLIAYNAGIKRLKKWSQNINESDPLAYIESIPIKETRMFVKYILTDLWIYRDKLGQSKPTREMLASDKWPTIPSQDFLIMRDAKLR